MPNAPIGTGKDSPPFQPLAAAAAWVIPGAGHWLLGHTRRGVLIFLGVLGLFAGGLFIGGISCVDRKESFFWFLGQSLAGPMTLGIDYVHQTHFKAYDRDALNTLRSPADLATLRRRAAFPYETRDHKQITLNDGGRSVQIDVPYFRVADRAKHESPPYSKSLGRANEMGTLFCTIAGFLNLICVIDAAWRRRAGDPRAAGGVLKPVPKAPVPLTAGARP